MEPMHSTTNFSLESFIDFLYSGLEGYAYLAANDPADKADWKQQFFAYPADVGNLIDTIKRVSKSHNIFLGPALYKEQKADKENIKCSNVVWTEFDGNAPDWEDSHGEPSLIIQSSGDLNQHCYWKLDEPITDTSILEDINLRITYNMGADASAWDATQVLRPPETTNYKYDDRPSVYVKQATDLIYDLSVFESLAPAPAQEKVDWELSVLPNVQEVILRYAFGPDMVRLMTAQTVKDRSAALMNLAYGCAEIGLTNNEIMAMLIMADDRWEKFKFRKDRYKRLAHIITIARNKYPDERSVEEQSPLMAFGFQSFLNTDIEIDWLIEGMLMEYGNMLMVGPSGIGKTQVTTQFLIHLALGKDFLHYKMPKPKKTLFLSLEMGHAEYKLITQHMASVLSDDEMGLLEENLIVIPFGEPLHLNTIEGQQAIIPFIEQFQPDVFGVDSIGSAVRGNISSDENIQPLTEFNDKIRKRYDLSTWYIHHLRKVREGSTSQDDVYGNQYLVNRATSIYGLLRGKEGAIKVRNFKQRLAAAEKDYYIKRDEDLMFHSINEDIDENIKTNLSGLPVDGPVGTKTEGGIDI